MALSLEDSSTQASWYAKEALFDTKIKTPEERMSEINAVTREDVQAVAKKIFRLKEARVAIIGDVKKDIELF
jgi:predicted Zn-dependent peptidase